MEALLQEYEDVLPRNVNEWLWLDAELSDVTLSLSSTHSSAGIESAGEALQQNTSFRNTGLVAAAAEGQGNSICAAADARSGRTRSASKDHTPASVTAGLQPQTSSISSAGTQTFRLHAVVLCSNSDYFRARITTAVGGSGSKRARCEAMTAEVEADQVEAAASVLRFFYTSKFTGKESLACSPEFLLQMLQVADCWQAPLALAAISTLLCKLQPGLFPVAAVYSLAGLNTSPAFADIQTHAECCLLEMFGDATAVATTPTLLQSFLSLPHAGIFTLLESAALVTDAEATVLLLLSEWCHSESGKACKPEELQQLNLLICYSCLSTPFLTELCETLHTPALTTDQRMDLLYFQNLGTPARKALVNMNQLNNLNGWYLQQRAAPLRSISTATLTLRMPEPDLYQLLAATNARTDSATPIPGLTSQLTYVQGFLWDLGLQSTPDGLWCGITVQAVGSLLAQNTGVTLRHGVVCNYSMKICGRTVAEDTVHDTGTALAVNSDGVGLRIGAKAQQFKAALERVWWQQYVVDGFVTIEASLSDISP